MGRPATILFLGANPSDTTRLALGREVREIRKRLHGSDQRDAFQLAQEWAVRATDLQECLLRVAPTIVHFSGHGRRTEEPERNPAAKTARDFLFEDEASEAAGALLLEDDAGRAKPVTTTAIAELFRILRGRVRCVILSACYTAAQAKAIAEHVDVVVGMTGAVDDEAAIAFAGSFYQALGYGQDANAAFELGRNQIELSGLSDVDKPTLITRSGVDAREVRFNEDRRVEAPPLREPSVHVPEVAPDLPPRASKLEPPKALVLNRWMAAGLRIGVGAALLLGFLLVWFVKRPISGDWTATFRLKGCDPGKAVTIEMHGGCSGAGRAAETSVRVQPKCDRDVLDVVVYTDSFEPFSYRTDAAAARAGSVVEIPWAAKPSVLAGTIAYDNGKLAIGARISLLGCAFAREERVDVNSSFKMALPHECRSIGPPFHLQVTPEEGPPQNFVIESWMTNRLTLRYITPFTDGTGAVGKEGAQPPPTTPTASRTSKLSEADRCAVALRKIRPKTWEVYCPCGGREPLRYVVPDAPDGGEGDGISVGKAEVTQRGWTCP